MGFSGELLFGRSERPLLEAPVFSNAGQEARSRASEWPVRPGGWQTLQFGFAVLEDPEAVLAGVISWTRSPACCVSVYDSDVAVITGLSPDGARWEACLNLELAAALWAEVPERVEDTSVWAVGPAFAEAVSCKREELDAGVRDSARGALAWADAAGFGAEVVAASVEELLRSRSSFVEELFSALLDALGFPEPRRVTVELGFAPGPDSWRSRRPRKGR